MYAMKFMTDKNCVEFFGESKNFFCARGPFTHDDAKFYKATGIVRLPAKMVFAHFFSASIAVTNVISYITETKVCQR